jgi:hypothetical protein
VIKRLERGQREKGEIRLGDDFNNEGESLP